MEVSSENSKADAKASHKVPRFFRHSLVHKSLELIYPENKPKSISDRTFRENLWWFFVLLIGFSLAFSVIDKAWQRFQLNPTFTSIVLNEDGMRVAYPTVGVCPNASIDSARVRSLLNRELSTKNNFSTIAEVIPNFEHLSREELKALSAALKTQDLRILTFKLALKCTDFIANCKFKGREIDCCTKFLPILSEHGLCFAFNTKVYGTSLSELKNPEIMSMIEFEDHRLLFELQQPSTLFVHSRDEFLNHQSQEITKVREAHSTNVKFSIRQTHMDAGARDLRLYQRKCFFDNERQSKFYASRRYSHAGCVRDCRVERVQKICGCLAPFYRPNNVENFTYCGIDDLACLQSERRSEKNRKCSECHLPCDFMSINVEKVASIPDDKNATRVSIDLHQWPYIAFYRDVRFGFIDFYVAFGSIFALFLGFSLLSLVELLLSLLRCVLGRAGGEKNVAA